MEGNRATPGNGCLVLCITKAVMFVAISVFVLYLPLGDPTAMECPDHGPQDPMCCLCDVYRFIQRAARKTGELVEQAAVICRDALYEAKLQFYRLLENVDRGDLCRSVCTGQQWEEEATEQQGPGKVRRVCRCIKKCCKQKA